MPIFPTERPKHMKRDAHLRQSVRQCRLNRCREIVCRVDASLALIAEENIAHAKVNHQPRATQSTTGRSGKLEWHSFSCRLRDRQSGGLPSLCSSDCVPTSAA
eukprot:scaffold210523_cov32-Tisochrysis_lutea.AAC.1